MHLQKSIDTCHPSAWAEIFTLFKLSACQRIILPDTAAYY